MSVPLEMHIVVYKYALKLHVHIVQLNLVVEDSICKENGYAEGHTLTLQIPKQAIHKITTT